MRPARIVVEPPIESCETATMTGAPPTGFGRRLVPRDFAGALVVFLLVAAGR
jgi:hypothetical protein